MGMATDELLHFFFIVIVCLIFLCVCIFSYRQNILKIRDLMNDQPQSPLERAVWWTEHVLRHGGTRHLRSPAWFLSWRQYYEVDFIVIILGGLLLTLVFVIATIRYLALLLIRSFTERVKVKRS